MPVRVSHFKIKEVHNHTCLKSLMTATMATGNGGERIYICIPLPRPIGWSQE
jgi:hypothetical protein